MEQDGRNYSIDDLTSQYVNKNYSSKVSEPSDSSIYKFKLFLANKLKKVTFLMENSVTKDQTEQIKKEDISKDEKTSYKDKSTTTIDTELEDTFPASDPPANY